MFDNAFPQLQEFCDQLNLDFEVVDLRWRAGVHIGTELRATGLHFSEIKRCENASLGPHFVVFTLFILLVQTNVKIAQMTVLLYSALQNSQLYNFSSKFQLLVGDKYGQGTPPLKIDANELEVLYSVAEHQNVKSRKLLDQWYILDLNSQPPVYVLQVNRKKIIHFVIKIQISI